MKMIVETPRYIRVHEDDNVAIVVNDNGLPAGTVFPCGLRLTEHVPRATKSRLALLRAAKPFAAMAK